MLPDGDAGGLEEAFIAERGRAAGGAPATSPDRPREVIEHLATHGARGGPLPQLGEREAGSADGARALRESDA